MNTVTVSENNINIKNSYCVSKKYFHNYYTNVKILYPFCKVPIKREYASLDFEWATHNAIYYIAKRFKLTKIINRVKDVDLNYPQKWYINWTYNIIGVIVWIFVK